MTILFICNEYPPGPHGGIGSATRSLARELARQGHTILVAGLYPCGYGGKNYEVDEGVRVWRLRLSCDKLLQHNYSLFDSAVRRVLTVTGILEKSTSLGMDSFLSFIQDLVKVHNVDIVECPDFNVHFKYLPGSLPWQELNVPLVVKCHGTNSYIGQRMGQAPEVHEFSLEQEQLKKADMLLAVSQHTANAYQHFYELAHKPFVLHNCINIEPYKKEVRMENTVVFTGAFSKVKGLHLLLLAWEKVIRQNPDARLYLFGKGKFRKYLRLLPPSARKTVINKGFASARELSDFLGRASLAVFPSLTECFALGPLEAMAAGCPVICSNRTSGGELVSHMENGLLADPTDTDALAQAIVYLLDHPGIRNSWSESGRRTVEERFSIRHSAAGHLNFYQYAIDTFRIKQLARASEVFFSGADQMEKLA